MKRQLGKRLFAIPSPVWLVGTYGEGDVPNLMPVSWAGIVSSEPPCVGISIKQGRVTQRNLARTGCFTVNIPSRDQVELVDRLGMTSGRDGDKFVREKLTAVSAAFVRAPYAEEFPLVLECKIIHRLAIGSHVQYIGEIVNVLAEEAVLDDDANLRVEALSPLVSAAPQRSYYRLGACIGKAYEIGTKENARFL